MAGILEYLYLSVISLFLSFLFFDEEERTTTIVMGCMDFPRVATPKEMEFHWFYKGWAVWGALRDAKRNGIPLVL